MRLRLAKIHEAKRIQEISKNNVFTYPLILYGLMAWLGWLYVLEVNNQISGYVCFIPIPFTNWAFILQICLKSNEQSKGFGKYILNKIYGVLKLKYRVKKLIAHVLKERSLKFFKSNKWKSIGNFFSITLLRKNLR